MRVKVVTTAPGSLHMINKYKLLILTNFKENRLLNIVITHVVMTNWTEIMLGANGKEGTSQRPSWQCY